MLSEKGVSESQRVGAILQLQFDLKSQKARSSEQLCSKYTIGDHCLELPRVLAVSGLSPGPEQAVPVRTTERAPTSAVLAGGY